MPMPTQPSITGVILSGGRATRMGGVDKGLQQHLGRPLVEHALARLAPQVGGLMINANRHLDRYQALGVPVWPDELADYPGPLAGFLAALHHCATPYLATVPCDSPRFPLDLVARLAHALHSEGAQIAMAATEDGPRLQPQPVFCLMHTSVAASLAEFIAGGHRKIERWAQQQRCTTVLFDDADAFFNANTADDLLNLQSLPPTTTPQ